MLCIGIRSAYTDLKFGYIYNKDLIPVFSIGGAVNIIYYFYFVRDIIPDFIINILIVFIIQVLLYGIHSFAGGDFKLGMLFAFLYPARLYLPYQGMITTLFFAFGIAFIYGYLFLLINSIQRIIKGVVRPDKRYFLLFIKKYFHSYLRAAVYITGLSLAVGLCENALFIPGFVLWILNIIVAMLSGRVVWMKNRFVILTVIIVDVVLVIILQAVPFSVDMGNYLFVAVLLLFQMLISTGIYETIRTADAVKGMILSTTSSVLMQGSRVKGIPGISMENLKDRLTEEQASSVRRWGETKSGKKEITIVRKIPFAIFLLLGFLTYFILWGVLYAT